MSVSLIPVKAHKVELTTLTLSFLSSSHFNHITTHPPPNFPRRSRCKSFLLPCSCVTAALFIMNPEKSQTHTALTFHSQPSEPHLHHTTHLHCLISPFLTIKFFYIHISSSDMQIKGLFTAVLANNLCRYPYHLSITSQLPPPSPWIWIYLRSYWFTILNSITFPIHITLTPCLYLAVKNNTPPKSLLPPNPFLPPFPPISKNMTQITKPPTTNDQGDLIISLEELEEGDGEFPHQILGMITATVP